MRNSRKGRFRVWDRSQDAFNGEDLVYNFDALDELIGGADGASGSSNNSEFNGHADTWLGLADSVPASVKKYPGTTNSGYENQTGRRTLYSVISGLNYNDVPLGTVITWWRPTQSVAVPDGWVPCDGRSLTASEHSFAVSGSITIPDLRNKFVLGADASVPGINAIDGYALAASATSAQNINNNWTGAKAGNGTTGAPGIGYDSGLETSDPRSGSNILRNISHNHTPGTLEIKNHYHSVVHTHTVPPHKHKVDPHDHDFAHTHLMPNHYHDFNTSSAFFTGQARVSAADGSEGKISFKAGTAGGQVNPASKDHVHRIDMNSAGSTGERMPIAGGNQGLFAFGSQSILWGFAGNPNAMSSGLGYGFQAVTSYPTWRRNSGNTLNSHEVRTRTDSYNPSYGSAQLFEGAGFAGVSSNGEIRTGNPIGSGSVSGGVTGNAGDTPSDVANSKKLLGTTAQESIYVNIRPQYVGLLYLMKVKVSTNII
jgi:hypothetical protein